VTRPVTGPISVSPAQGTFSQTSQLSDLWNPGSRVGWFVVRGCWVGWSAGGWGVHDPGLFYASSSPVSPSKIKIKNKVKIKIKIKVKIRVKIKVKPMVKG
jgi:hypothetical protein